MQTLEPGVTIQELLVAGQSIQAMVFCHSRKKQIVALVALLVFALGFVGMYSGAKTAEWPLIGRSPTFTRVLAIGGALFMAGTSLWYSTLLMRLQTYVALLPEGILSSTTTPPLYILWGNIGDMAAYGSGAKRGLGIMVKNVEDTPTLHPFRKRMKSNRSFSGWDWAFGLQAFEARPELIETALQYFYSYPGKCQEIGTPQGLKSIEEAIKQHWQKPPQRDTSSTYPAMIEEYRERFKRAPLGRWDTPYEFGPFASDAWEFYADGTGMLSQYSSSGESVMLFEWQPESERTIKFREIEWDGDIDENEREGGEPVTSGDAEPMGWGTLVYDFKVIEHYIPLVVMFEVPEGNVCKFWLTMDYLQFSGGIGD